MVNNRQNRFSKFLSQITPKDGPAKQYIERVDRVVNSRMVNNALDNFKTRRDNLLTNSTAMSTKSYKNIVSWIPPPPKLDPVDTKNEETALRDLLALPNFQERCKEEFRRLPIAIADWRAQGGNLQQRATRDPGLHAVIFSEDEDTPIQFARHYFAFLAAAGIIPSGQQLVKADGSSFRSMWSIEGLDGGMCLVINAKDLSSGGARDLSEWMHEHNIVIVYSYVGVGEKLHSSVESSRFFLNLVLLEEQAAKSSEERVQDAMQPWVKDNIGNNVYLEDGFDGQFARMFAKRIVAATEDQDDTKRTAKMEQELAAVRKRQLTRLASRNSDATKRDDPCLITMEDLLGGPPSLATLKVDAWEDLNKMAGLEEVKETVRAFLNGQLLDYYRGIRGKKPSRSGLSTVFVGPPGTGKTTVAKLYGQILCDLKLLSSGEMMVKKASDFIGPYLGQSERQTRQIFKEAKGKVLFIDEAYMLDPNQHQSVRGPCPYRQAVITTIVGEVDNTPDQDMCVILAGYESEMRHMLESTDANPGLARRFPMSSAFRFEEFDEKQLKAVLRVKMKEFDIELTTEAEKVAVSKLMLAKQRANFGNGGEVNNLLDIARKNFLIRFGKMSPEQHKDADNLIFLAQDIDPDWNSAMQPETVISETFVDFSGQETVRDRLMELAQQAQALRGNGVETAPFMPMHLAFIGPRGTGKKTLAAKTGRIFQSMGMIPTADVVQKSARELISKRMTSSYSISQANADSLSAQWLHEALGKVLVIREAQQLCGGDAEINDRLVLEAREELLEAMNEERFFRKTVVLLLGHGLKFERVLKNSQSLGAKFTTHCRFKSLSGIHCVQFLKKGITDRAVDVQLTPEDEATISGAFEVLQDSNGWSNYGDVDQISSKLVAQAFSKAYFENSPLLVTVDDILHHLTTSFPQLQNLRKELLNIDSPEEELHGGTEIENTEASLPQVQTSASGERNENESLGTIAVPSQSKPQTTTSIVASDRTTEAESTRESPFPVQSTVPPEPSEDESFRTSALALQPTSQTNTTIAASDFAVHPAYNGLPLFEYSPLPDDKSIRVFQLDPANTLDEPIKCRLKVVNLNNETAGTNGDLRFDAVSYCWGGQDRAHPILCDGKILKVTARAVEALRHLRQKSEPCTLWMDTICINQPSTAELNQQVGLMGDIYCAATRVFIWLDGVSSDELSAIETIQRLCALKKAEKSGSQSEQEFEVDKSTFRALNTLMKHPWWKRMWTFQEFVVARHPAFVTGPLVIEWEEFQFLVTQLITHTNQMQRTVRNATPQGKSSIMKRLFADLPSDVEVPAEIEASVHMFPTWLGVWDVLICRKAFQARSKSAAEAGFLGSFLLQTRNRGSHHEHDKAFGLYYLLEKFGLELPPVNYGRPLRDVYQDVASALLNKSQSWWMLAHLFNKRDESSLALPSWVPDFSTHMAWHQTADLRFQNLNELLPAYSSDLRPSHAKQWVPTVPFWLRQSEDGYTETKAVFLWRVMKVTGSMPAEPVLDRCFEEEFEQTDFIILQSAMDRFLISLARWMKDLIGDVSEANDAVPTSLVQIGGEEFLEKEAEVIKAISSSFIRAMWDMVRSLTQRRNPKAHVTEAEEVDDNDIDEIQSAETQAEDDGLSAREALHALARKFAPNLKKEEIDTGLDKWEASVSKHRHETEALQSELKPEDYIDVLRRILHNVRSCIHPDANHSCRSCKTTEPHLGNDGARCFNKWMRANGINEMNDLRYLLYSQSVNHSMFLTAPTAHCKGHFAICRNRPQVGDEVILLAGLTDPVVVRKTDVNEYEVVGVTKGIVGELCWDLQGDYCLGSCGELDRSGDREPQSFFLV